MGELKYDNAELKADIKDLNSKLDRMLDIAQANQS